MTQPKPSATTSTYPTSGGAYVLESRVREELSVQVGRLGEITFEPGRYLYVGSAYGPGGIAARVKRHLKAKKRRLHWHIDYLSAVIGVERVWVIPVGHECEIVSALLTDSETSTPFIGFGSSDCRQCTAHLLLAGEQLSLPKALPNEARMHHVGGGPPR